MDRETLRQLDRIESGLAHIIELMEGKKDEKEKVRVKDMDE